MWRARIARALRILYGIRGWQSIVNRLVPEHSGGFTIYNGEVAFAGDIRSFIDRQVYLFGGYESAQIRAFLAHVPGERRRVILDIGANVGTHTLQFARAFDVVHAFEPNAMLWSQFESNILLNRLVNVNLHKVGLGDSDGEMTLHMIDKPNYGLGTFSAVEQYDLPLQAVATCPVRHAGSFVAQLHDGPIDAVKIDVQGFELEVLRGLADVFARSRPVVWCEVGAGALTKAGTVAELSTLFPYEIRCMRFDIGSGMLAGSVELTVCDGVVSAGDYLFVPDNATVGGGGTNAADSRRRRSRE